MQRKDKHGITPILAAIWEGHTSCVEYLLKKVAIYVAECMLFINNYLIAGRKQKRFYSRRPKLS